MRLFEPPALDSAEPAADQPVAPDRRLRLVPAALAALWLLSSVYIVPADQQAVVTRFGAVVEPRVLPGIHLSLPWPLDRVTRLKVQQLRRAMIGGALSDQVLGRAQGATSQFLTGDQNLIHLRVAVQYSVGVPSEFLYTAEDVERLVVSAVEGQLARGVAGRGVDAVLTTEKAAIQDEVRAESQRVLNEYRSGVAVAAVSIESAAPPQETAEAFRDVASARADAARIVNESEGYANDVIPKARGEAQQLIEQSASYKQRKTNEAAGDAARFTQVAGEYQKAAEVNGHRLYMEAMEQVLPRIRKMIVDREGNLDLTIIRKGDLEPGRR
ncbi:MAG: FtsH protease activity modulator HflK [Acidobacteria bacterium]|nr:FtsH protease activity modulator HflK [Acidobacteriota bacterium]